MPSDKKPQKREYVVAGAGGASGLTAAVAHEVKLMNQDEANYHKFSAQLRSATFRRNAAHDRRDFRHETTATMGKPLGKPSSSKALIRLEDYNRMHKPIARPVPMSEETLYHLKRTGESLNEAKKWGNKATKAARIRNAGLAGYGGAIGYLAYKEKKRKGKVKKELGDPKTVLARHAQTAYKNARIDRDMFLFNRQNQKKWPKQAQNMEGEATVYRIASKQNRHLGEALTASRRVIKAVSGDVSKGVPAAKYGPKLRVKRVKAGVKRGRFQINAKTGKKTPGEGEYWKDKPVQYPTRKIELRQMRMDDFGKAMLPELPWTGPRAFLHKSHGMVSFRAYHGNGMFTVIGKGDQRILTHRDQLTFLKPKRSIQKNLPPKPINFPGSDDDWAKAYAGQQERRAKQAAEKASAKATKAKTVAASVPKATTFRELVSPSRVTNVAAALTVGGYATHKLRQRTKVQPIAKKSTSDEKKNLALGGIAGAAGTEAGYIVGGQGLKGYLKVQRNKKGLTPEQEDIWAKHKQKAGLAPGARPEKNTPFHIRDKIYTKYPKELPHWRAQRLLGYKSRDSVYAATLAAGAGAGMAYAHHRNKKMKMAKSLVPLDQHIEKSLASNIANMARGTKKVEQITINDAPAVKTVTSGGWIFKPKSKIVHTFDGQKIVTSTGGGLTPGGKTLVAAGALTGAGGTYYEHDRRYVKRPKVKPRPAIRKSYVPARMASGAAKTHNKAGMLYRDARLARIAGSKEKAAIYRDAGNKLGRMARMERRLEGGHKLIPVQRKPD